MSTPTTAMTIHSQGPRKMRLTSMSRAWAPTSYQFIRTTKRRYTRVLTKKTRSRVPSIVPVIAVIRLSGRECSPAGSGVHVRGERADAPQVAVALGVVEAVAHDELVGDVVADVLHVHGHLQRLRLAQQRADLDGRRAARGQVGHQPRQRETGVDDVLDDQDVPVGDVGVEVLEDPHDA